MNKQDYVQSIEVIVPTEEIGLESRTKLWDRLNFRIQYLHGVERYKEVIDKVNITCCDAINISTKGYRQSVILKIVVPFDYLFEEYKYDIFMECVGVIFDLLACEADNGCLEGILYRSSTTVHIRYFKSGTPSYILEGYDQFIKKFVNTTMKNIINKGE